MDCCQICKKVCKGNSRAQYPLRYGDRNGMFAHAGCVQCVKCSNPMAFVPKGKDGSARSYGTYYWHAGCATCKCGITGDNAIFTIQEGKLIHYRCTYNTEPCIICSKEIATQTFIYTHDSRPIHIDCITTLSCIACKNQFTDNDYVMREKNGLRHNHCNMSPCQICHEPLGSRLMQQEWSVDFGYIKAHPDCFSPLLKRIKNISCQHDMTNPIIFWGGWVPDGSTNKFHTVECQAAIKTMFLMHAKHENNVWSMIPKDIIKYIAGFVATPDGWSVMNGILITEICTPLRCKDDLNCKLCTKPFNWYGTGSMCTKYKCEEYELECEKCGGCVPYNVDPMENCTEYRCKLERCKLCKDKLFPRRSGNTTMCNKTWCKTYFPQKCTCGVYIRKDPESPLNECSKYRCIKDRCEICGNGLAPRETCDTKQCNKIICWTVRHTVWNRFQNIKIWLDWIPEPEEYTYHPLEWYKKQICQLKLDMTYRETESLNPAEFMRLEMAITGLEKMLKDLN